MAKEILSNISKKINNSVFIRNTLFNYLINILIYLFGFLTTPLLLSYLNKSDFGIYQTILMFLSWVLLLDLGIGNGLRNKVSELYATRDYDKLKKIVGSAFFIASCLFFIMILVGGVFFVLIFQPQWLFSDIISNISDVKNSFLISYLFLSLNFIVGLFASICFGLQKSHLVSLSKLINSVLFCILIFILLKLNVSPQISIASFGFGISMMLSASLLFFIVKKNKRIWPPRYSMVENKEENKSLFKISSGFLILQISTMFLFTVDNFIVAKTLGSESVTDYSIAYKLFFFIIGIFSILLIQLWNAVSHAKATHNKDWIKKVVGRLYLTLIPIAIVCLLICFFYDTITLLWLGTTFNVSSIFLLLFALYTVIHCFNGICVNVLNGLSRIRWQTAIYLFAGLFNILLAYFLVVKLNMGITGVILSKTICIACTSIVCFWDYRYYMKHVFN